MTKASVTLRGVDTTLRALKIIDPEAMKALRVGFKDAATPILNKAKSNVPARPLSGWGGWINDKDGRDLSWDSSKVQRGLRSKVSVSKKRAGLQLVNASPAGAIWEMAGSKDAQRNVRTSRVNQSKAFNRLANGRSDPPRLLVKTWKEEKGIKQTYVAVTKLIGDAESRVQKAMAK
jgi:hypothetical protein